MMGWGTSPSGGSAAVQAGLYTRAHAGSITRPTVGVGGGPVRRACWPSMRRARKTCRTSAGAARGLCGWSGGGSKAVNPALSYKPGG